VKNGPNEAAAKIFIDWALSLETQSFLVQEMGRRPVRSDVPISPDLPPMSEIKTVPYDFAWSAGGKTTLLRTIAGFYKQDTGHISIDDQLIDDIPAYKRYTGMVFQSYAVFPHMTVYENVAFGLKTRKVEAAEIKEKVTNALAQVHLTGYETRTPDQLSGGQQQRVGLARAMVIEPKVLLMDEPLSNLDAKLREDMRDEIRNMQKLLGNNNNICYS